MNVNEAGWPESLRINAAAVQLAIALHEARADAFGPYGVFFSELTPAQRQAYIEVATAILKATKPDKGLPEDLQDIAPALQRIHFRMVKIHGR